MKCWVCEKESDQELCEFHRFYLNRDPRMFDAMKKHILVLERICMKYMESDCARGYLSARDLFDSMYRHFQKVEEREDVS